MEHQSTESIGTGTADLIIDVEHTPTRRAKPTRTPPLTQLRQKGLTGATKPPHRPEPAGVLMITAPQSPPTADDAARQGHVTDDGTALYAKRDANQEVLGRLYSGTNLEILDRTPATKGDDPSQDLTEWVQVRVVLPGQSDGTDGWVDGRYVASGHLPAAVDTLATCHVAVSPGLYLRREAGQDQRRVQPTPLPKGLNLEILGRTRVTSGYDLAQQSKTWLHVRVRSTSVEGWVPKEDTAVGSSFLPTAIARLMPLIDQASIATGLSPALIAAVVWQESMGDPHARSGAHAWGLMHLEPGTAREYGGTAYGMTFKGGFRSDNPIHRSIILDPRNNVLTGATYLAYLLNRYRAVEWGCTPEQLAAAAYNAGPTAVDNAQGIPHSAETHAYVAAVLSLHQRFSDALHIPGPWHVHTRIAQHRL